MMRDSTAWLVQMKRVRKLVVVVFGLLTCHSVYFDRRYGVR
jgi:hypothetical protein